MDTRYLLWGQIWYLTVDTESNSKIYLSIIKDQIIYIYIYDKL